MSAGLAPWRALIRLAWRDTTRHKGRTALVVAMIGVPVAILCMGSVLIRSIVLTPEQQWRLSVGRVADLVLEPNTYPQNGMPVLQPGAVPPLPPSARSVTLMSGSVRVTVGNSASRSIWASNESGPFTDPILSGVYLLRQGSWPATNGEAAITTALASAAHFKLGQTVTLAIPKRTVTISGIYDTRNDLRALSVATQAPIDGTDFSRDRHTSIWVDLGPGVSAQQARTVAEGLMGAGWLDRFGYLSLQGTYGSAPLNWGAYRGPQSDQGTPLAMMNVGGVILLFLLGTIVTAAFAVGARRQLRTLGLIAANGGDPRQLRRIVTLQGTVAAVGGAVAGLAIGAVGLIVIAPHLNRFATRVLPGIEFMPLDMVLAFLMALVAGSLAAALPGRAIAKVPVLTALGGRRPVRSVAAAVPMVAVIISGVGIGVLAAASRPGHLRSSWPFAAVGGIAVLLGGVLLAPWIVSRLAPLTGRLQGAGRLAARTIVRHRSRSGPIIGAIMAAGALTVGVNTLVQSADQGFRDRYRPTIARNQVQIIPDNASATRTADPVPFASVDANVMALQAIAAILPGSIVAPYVRIVPSSAELSQWYRIARTDPTDGSTMSQLPLQIFSGDVELLRALKADAATIAAFEAGQTILSGPNSGPSSVEIIESSQRGDQSNGVTPPTERHIRLTTMPTRALDLGQQINTKSCDGNRCVMIPGTILIVPDAVGRSNGFTFAPATVVIAPAAITAHQRSRLGGVTSAIYDQIDRETGSNFHGDIIPMIVFEQARFAPVRIVQAVLTLLALLLALGVTGLSLALTAADNRVDEATLASLGASPGVRRRMRAWEAGLLAVLGMALAIPIGFLPGAAIVSVQGSGDPIVFPWLVALGLVVLIPLASAAVGWVSARTPRHLTVLPVDR